MTTTNPYGRRLAVDQVDAIQDLIRRVRRHGLGVPGRLDRRPGHRLAPIREGVAIALMPEATARAVCPADMAVVPVQPPPQCVLALESGSGQQPAPVHRFLSYVRSYRDQHAWI
jgi:hypothetical protein